MHSPTAAHPLMLFCPPKSAKNCPRLGPQVSLLSSSTGNSLQHISSWVPQDKTGNSSIPREASAAAPESPGKRLFQTAVWQKKK